MLQFGLFMAASILFLVAGFAFPPENPWHNRLVCIGLAAISIAFLVGTKF
jgi:hypothetical protein